MTADPSGPHTELAARPGRAHTTLAPGSQLDGYRIDAELGRGGMGVVYRATDLKLNRPVAIKLVSDEHFDAAAGRRFKREAEIASGLNHPHIVTVYDVAEHGGREYIVSELVEGATLDVWAAEPRSVREKLELLIGVADGLAAAHAAGILHRDIKPGNILVATNGYAKLADFGLAVRGGAVERDARSPRYTAAGLVVGTVAYMSPEQTAGRALDERSDLFSFGVVLYELFAGRRPFDAPTDLEVLKGIVEAPHPPLPEGLPATLRAAIDKALEKDPADRYQSMRELGVDLRRVARKGGTAPQAALPARAPSRRWSALDSALALALAAALVPAVLYFRAAPTPARAVAFDMTVPASTRMMALSPDGETLAYAALDGGGNSSLFVQTLGSSVAREVPNTDGAEGPFWSADAESLAFAASGALQRVDVTGAAPPVELARRPGALGGAWSSDGTILFTSMATGATGGNALGVIGSIGANGDLVARTANVTQGVNAFHYAPVLLPGGRRYLFVEQHRPNANAPDEAVISLGSLDSDEVVSVVALGAIARTEPAPVRLGYANGWLLYTKSRTLLAQRFDAATAAVTGEPVVLADGVDQFSVAGDVLAYRGSATATPTGLSTDPLSQIRWYSRNGAQLEAVTDPERNVGSFELSPDGGRLALLRERDLWTRDLAGGAPRRLTFNGFTSVARLLWYPDGSQVVFSSAHEHTDLFATNLYRRAANGSGTEELLHAGGAAQLLPIGWSADGDLLFSQIPADDETARSFWRLRAGERAVAPIMESRADVIHARLSPDGHWLAYATAEYGAVEVVVQPYPDLSRGKWQISTGGGAEPRWRSDGGELFFTKPDGTLTAVAVDADPATGTFVAGPPVPLFRAPFAGRLGGEVIRYTVDGEGQKFLVRVRVESTDGVGAADSTVRVLVNWRSSIAAN